MMNGTGIVDKYWILESVLCQANECNFILLVKRIYQWLQSEDKYDHLYFRKIILPTVREADRLG